MFNKLVRGAATLGTMIGAYEVMMRWWEARQLEKGWEYWRNYHDPAMVERADAIRQTETLVSTGTALHIDIYPQADPDAPVLVFNHGGGSYARPLLGVQMAFYDKGYTVVAGDRRGQGLSAGRRGDTTWSLEVQNALDIARWSKKTFNRPQFMIGCSMGGPLSYYTAVAGAPIEATACFNLYDWSADSPDFVDLFGGWAQVLRQGWPLFKPLGWLSVPWHKLNPEVWSRGIDHREPHIQAIWEKDPLPIALVTLAYLHSLGATAPAIPFEQNTFPVMVINPNLDRMSDPAVTRRNFERLGGPKDYAEVPYGHYAFDEGFGKSIADAADTWFKRYMPADKANGNRARAAKVSG